MCNISEIRKTAVQAVYIFLAHVLLFNPVCHQGHSAARQAAKDPEPEPAAKPSTSVCIDSQAGNHELNNPFSF